MDFETIIAISGVCLIIAIYICILVAFMLVAGLVASTLGLTGVLWWAVAIVVFLLLAGILSMINRIGRR